MFAARHLDYNQTNAFSRIVIDYLNGDQKLRPFYSLPPAKSSMEEIIRQKQMQPTDRQLLVEVLRSQYQKVQATENTAANIEALLSPHTFTITTAHQPNLFTGPLYFIYKILHAIRIAEELNSSFANFHFVPVYYMGSEDADFAELNHTWVEGKKIEWKKEQKGAVGRMKVDGSLQQLIGELEGQLIVEKHGKEVISLLKQSYTTGRTIEEATFELVNTLYGKYGLVVLLPDNPLLKKQMHRIFEAELFENASYKIVTDTTARLEEYYGSQAHVREINLFYLKDDIRERIERTGQGFQVVHTDISFTVDAMRQELTDHPERFSPNVILRGLYQETILPNIIFVGGGGELAYWLQLKDLFAHYKTVFPVLELRNSFLVIEEKWKQLVNKLSLQAEELFLPLDQLMKQIVTAESSNAISLNGNFEKAEALFEQIGTQAAAIDPTLQKHVAAIRTKALKNLQALEKKMYRAEKKKFTARQNQLQKLKDHLFPNHSLQERVENFSSFYACWGEIFMDELYRHSPAFDQKFILLTEQNES